MVVVLARRPRVRDRPFPLGQDVAVWRAHLSVCDDLPHVRLEDPLDAEVETVAVPRRVPVDLKQRAVVEVAVQGRDVRSVSKSLTPRSGSGWCVFRDRRPARGHGSLSRGRTDRRCRAAVPGVRVFRDSRAMIFRSTGGGRAPEGNGRSHGETRGGTPRVPTGRKSSCESWTGSRLVEARGTWGPSGTDPLPLLLTDRVSGGGGWTL